MHQPVVVQNKQENYIDFLYKPLLQQNLQNGRLEREVFANTLMNGKVIVYVTQRKYVYLKIVRCITPCMRNGRHSEYWLLTTGIMNSHLYPERKNLGAATLLSNWYSVSLFVKACLCETLCIVCTQHNQIFYM